MRARVWLEFRPKALSQSNSSSVGSVFSMRLPGEFPFSCLFHTRQAFPCQALRLQLLLNDSSRPHLIALPAHVRGDVCTLKLLISHPIRQTLHEITTSELPSSSDPLRSPWGIMSHRSTRLPEPPTSPVAVPALWFWPLVVDAGVRVASSPQMEI